MLKQDVFLLQFMPKIFTYQVIHFSKAFAFDMWAVSLLYYICGKFVEIRPVSKEILITSCRIGVDLTLQTTYGWMDSGLAAGRMTQKQCFLPTVVGRCVKMCKYKYREMYI